MTVHHRGEPWSRCRTGSVHALSLCCSVVNAPRSCCSCCTDDGPRLDGPRSSYSCSLGCRFGQRLLQNLSHTGGTKKHAMSRVTIEIALSLNGTIILACSIIEFDADPFACAKESITNKANMPDSTIGKFYKLSNLQMDRRGHSRRCTVDTSSGAVRR